MLPIDRPGKIVTHVRDAVWWGERPKLDQFSFTEVVGAYLAAALANRIDEELWKIAHQLPLYHQPGAVAIRSTIANLGARGYGQYEYEKIGFTG